MRLVAFALVLALTSPAGASWSSTKRKAAEVYSERRVTFYCGCPYRGNQVLSCEYEPQAKWRRRADRVEWEHVVPVSLMGCGSRFSCERLVPEAVYDLHNLVPAIGQVNAYRSDDPHSYADGEPWRGCGLVDSGSTFEPPDAVKGDVARTWLYMHVRHGVPLTTSQIILYVRWSMQDPVDEWERERNRRIREAQGNSNPFVP